MSWSLTLHSCFILIYGIIAHQSVERFWGDFRFFTGCWWNMTTNEQTYSYCGDKQWAVGASSWSFSISTCKQTQILSNPFLWVWLPGRGNLPGMKSLLSEPQPHILWISMSICYFGDFSNFTMRKLTILTRDIFQVIRSDLCCPPVGGHLYSLWKGHLTIRKKVEKNCQVFSYFPTMPNKSQCHQCPVIQVALPV